MIEWNKDTQKQSDSVKDHIREMGTAVDDFCRELTNESQDFSPKDFFGKLYDYIHKDGRLLYTNITNYVFSLDEETFGIIQTNLDQVIQYIYSEQFKLDYRCQNKRDSNLYGRTKRTVLKLWDHMNLAKRQYSLFKMKDENYGKIVDAKMADAELRLSKEMNSQLISLVSIFTALSFLLFGGISSLDNIFIGAKDIPVTKLMIVGTIWCFCIMNLVFVFMFFVAKLTGLNIKSSQDVNANLVQKYPLIWWCNFVLISILCFACWAYYIKGEGFSRATYSFLYRHSTCFFILGTAMITGLIVLIAIKIYKLSKIELSD